MSWFDVLPAIGLGLLILLAPGLLIAAAMRVRGFDALGLAPLLSVAVLLVAALLSPYLGWSLWLLLLTSLVMALIARIVSTLLVDTSLWDAPVSSRQRTLEVAPWFSREQIPYWASFFLGVVLLWRNVTNSLGQPDWISQTWDNIFHLNAIRWIMDTGSASPLTVGAMTAGEGGSTFYPATWHALVSLIFAGSGVSIPVATSTTALLVSAVAWPAGMVFLVRNVLRAQPATTVLVGALTASFTAFPVLLLHFGVLYPNLLGIALLPAALGLLVQLLRLAEVRRMSTLQSAILLAWGLFALALAHPNVMMSLLLLSLPILLVSWLLQLLDTWNKRKSPLAFAGSSLAIVAYLLVFNWLWNTVRPVQEAGPWEPVTTQAQGIGEALTQGVMSKDPLWFLTILTLIGVYASLRMFKLRVIWVPLAWLLIFAFYVMGRSLSWEEDRYFWTGIWYHDTYRLAALLPVVTVLLIVLGLEWLLARLRSAGFWSSFPRLTGQQISAVLGALALVLTLGFTQTAKALEEQVEKSFFFYAPSLDSPLLDTDEWDVLNHLPDYVPEDATIMVQAFNGSPLAYALTGRKVTVQHALDTPSQDIVYLQDHLDEALKDTRVCSLLSQEGIGYYLDFGSQEVNDGDHSSWYRGFNQLVQRGLVTELYRSGHAVLYQITACSTPAAG